MLRGYRDACAGADDGLTTVLNMTTAPPVLFLPEAVHGKPVVAVLGMWSGALDDGDTATSPFRHLAEPDRGPLRADAHRAYAVAPSTRSIRAVCTTTSTPAFVPALDDGVRQALDLGVPAGAERDVRAARAPSGRSDGAGCRRTRPRSRPGIRTSSSTWSPARPTTEHFDTVRDWARAIPGALGSGQAYVNFTSEAGTDRVRASYPPATYQRLVAVKDRYDPDNLFRLNQNIQPLSLNTGGATERPAGPAGRPVAETEAARGGTGVDRQP